jgi:hypothetical protein
MKSMALAETGFSTNMAHFSRDAINRPVGALALYFFTTK